MIQMYRLQEVESQDLCLFVLDLIVLVEILLLVIWTEVSCIQDDAFLLELRHPAF